MKAYLDHEGCISCGFCVESCPEVFRFADDGKAEVIAEKVPDENETQVVDAQENCPVSVILAKE